MKRLHIPHSAHHVTFNPEGREEYFLEDIFCHIVIDSIEWAEQHKDCVVLGWKINREHIHLVVQVRETFKISEIMHSIKRVSSIRINQILLDGTEWKSSLLDEFPGQDLYRKFFQRKYDEAGIYHFDKFKWQPGYFNRICRSPEHLKATIEYISSQADRHNLDSNRFLFVRQSRPRNITFPIFGIM